MTPPLVRSSALTVVAEIDPGKRADLDKRLAVIAEDLDGRDGENHVFRVHDLPHTHFIRWLILPDRERELPPMLVMESNHDGPVEPYLRALAAHAPDGLDALFGCCLGYPAGGARDAGAFVAWMKRHSIPVAAFYCAYRDVPKAQVDNDREVHAAIRRLIDGDPSQFRGELPRRALEKIRAVMRATTLDISPLPDDQPRFDAELRRTKRLAVAGVLAALPVLLPALPALLLTLRWKESRDKPKVFPHPVQDRGHHQRDEDFIVQNQLSNVVDVKPGVFRYLLLRTVLFAIHQAARVYFVKGDLGGITSIHFARWVIVKDPRPWRPFRRRRHRLVFFSNYDASWESYLGEFVDRAAGGLTAVWGNTDGFPRARWLKEDGADDEEAFKNWARDIQIPTQVWWSGVHNSTTQNVRDDIWIRRRLERELTDEEIVEWLRRL